MTSFLYCDESFADLTGIAAVSAMGRTIRSRIFKCTGIPVGVGIAHTKTLAKLANHTAKRLQAQTGGVVNLCGVAPALLQIKGRYEVERAKY